MGFAVDVDGTITENGGALNLDAAHSLRWLERLGYRVVLVSGRGVWDLFALATYLGTTELVVAENGGVVASSPLEMILLADKADCIVAYEYLSQHIEEVTLKASFPRVTEVQLERTFDIRKANLLLEEQGLPVIVIDSKYAYHIINKNVNKGRGLGTALNVLGLPSSGIVAIGDSDTDIPMFELCAYSVALGNAPASTKAKSKHCVVGQYGEGLIEAVQHVVQHVMKKDWSK